MTGALRSQPRARGTTRAPRRARPSPRAMPRTTARTRLTLRAVRAAPRRTRPARSVNASSSSARAGCPTSPSATAPTPSDSGASARKRARARDHLGCGVPDRRVGRGRITRPFRARGWARHRLRPLPSPRARPDRVRSADAHTRLRTTDALLLRPGRRPRARELRPQRPRDVAALGPRSSHAIHEALRGLRLRFPTTRTTRCSRGAASRSRPYAPIPAIATSSPTKRVPDRR